jgi:hypothetical protein
MKQINAMTLLNRPMSDKHFQGVTVRVSEIGQPRFVRLWRPG